MAQNLNSRSTKTLALLSGSTIERFGAIGLAMVLSRLLSIQDWGSYRQTLLVFQMAAPLLGLGLSKALFYFLPGKEGRNRGILVENLIPLGITGTGYAAFMMLGGNVLLAKLFNNPVLEITLLVTAPIAIFQLLSSCVGSCLISSEKVFPAAIFNASTKIFVIVAILIAVYFSPSLLSALWAQIIALGAVTCLGISMMFSYCRNGTPTLRGIKSQVNYGIPLGISSMIGALSVNTDRAMVSGSCSLEEYAIYDNGALQLPLVGIITGSMTSILLVDYRVMLAEGQREKEILALMHRATLKSGMVLIPTMFFLLCVAPDFMATVFGEKYRDSATVFRIYLLLLPIRTTVLGAIALAAGKTKSLAAMSVVTIISNIILNWVAIRYFGYIGCAAATVFVTYSVSAVGRAYISQQVVKCSMFEFLPWQGMGKLMLVASTPVPFVIATLNAVGDASPIIRLALTLMVYLSVFLPIASFFEVVHLRALLRKISKGY